MSCRRMEELVQDQASGLVSGHVAASGKRFWRKLLDRFSIVRV